jgi:NAD(P)-dependent dehydrogenase (short-subunit alcohol dehydrogenase family)
MRAYSESKLYVAALAFAVARHWPDVLSNAVDPGWVPTKMGGPGAPDDLEMAYGQNNYRTLGASALGGRRPWRRPGLTANARAER